MARRAMFELFQFFTKTPKDVQLSGDYPKGIVDAL